MVVVWVEVHEKGVEVEKMPAKEDNQLRIEPREVPDSI